MFTGGHGDQGNIGSRSSRGSRRIDQSDGGSLIIPEQDTLRCLLALALVFQGVVTGTTAFVFRWTMLPPQISAIVLGFAASLWLPRRPLAGAPLLLICFMGLCALLSVYAGLTAMALASRRLLLLGAGLQARSLVAAGGRCAPLRTAPSPLFSDLARN